jgi:hypothetical protein
MDQLKTFFEKNKGPKVFGAVFILLFCIAGWFAVSAWLDMNSAEQELAGECQKLSGLLGENPAPSEANLSQLIKAVESEKSSLKELQATLQRFNISEIPTLQKAKPQDAPRILQDTLRDRVNAIKSRASANHSALPQGFYLAMEDYENKLPLPEDCTQLSKQITVFNWIAEKLVSHNGLLIEEFAKPAPASGQAAKSDRKPLPANPAKNDLPYETRAALKLSFRCDQASLREILNDFSRSPYFLLIDSLKLQNTATEPPKHETAAQQTSQPEATPPQEGEQAVQRIPIVVGREMVNVTFRIQVLEFPDRNPPKATAK